MIEMIPKQCLATKVRPCLALNDDGRHGGDEAPGGGLAGEGAGGGAAGQGEGKAVGDNNEAGGRGEVGRGHGASLVCTAISVICIIYTI